MGEERLIGHVAVDSGSVVVGDPDRIDGTTAVQVHGTIMTMIPAGDDMYPVYADVDNDGRVLGLRIDLRPSPT